MMKLRIIDNFPNDTIRLELTESDTVEQFTSEPFASPFSQAFLANFSKLFSRLPDEVETNPLSADVMDKFIRYGQHLGDALLGENHTLNKFREMIEEQGYAQCKVTVESSRIAFFELPWEALILPESHYLLATTAFSFQRIFTPKPSNASLSDSLDTHFEDVHLHLQVTGPTQTQLSQMMGNTTSSTQESANNQPLNLLSLCYPRQPFAHSQDTHTQVQQNIEHTLAFDLLGTDTAIQPRIHGFQNLETLKQELASRPTHVLSLSGNIELKDAQAYWVSPFNAAHSVPLHTLFSLMQAHQIPLLVLNVDSYLRDNSTCENNSSQSNRQEAQYLSAATGLACVSYQAQQAGIGNVLGFNQEATPALRLSCLSAFYRQLTKGLSLAQAVVETRKALQSIAQTPFTAPGWPILAHYGSQHLVFFDNAPPDIAADTALYAQQIHQGLFGFIEEALPPYNVSLDQGEFVEALTALQSHKTCCITGNQGMGKTLLAHQLAFYLLEQNQYQWAFRFDFSKHAYQPHDILQMVAPILKLDDTKTSHASEAAFKALMSALAQTRCLFVFDGLFDTQSSAEMQDAFTAFLANLRAQQQGIVITQSGFNNPTAPLPLNAHKVHIAPLSRALCLSLTLTQMAQSQAQHGQQEPNPLPAPALSKIMLMLAQGEYNPWLAIRLGTYIGTPTVAKAKLDTQAVLERIAPQWQHALAHLPHRHSNPVQAHTKDLIKANYYQWQWSQLTESAQQLLLICSDCHDALLEMLMVAWERESDIREPLSALLAQPVFSDTLANFSALIRQWQRQGFVKMRPHGHVMDTDCNAFLTSKRQDAQWLTSDTLQTQVSRLICAGLRILTDHVLRQQNPAIFRNLLNNRGLWAKHLQTLWHSACFAEFIKTKACVAQLMQQAQLGQEFAMWARKLVTEIAIPTIDESAPEASIAWLSLAANALENNDAKTDANDFTLAAEQAKHWLLKTQATSEQKLSAPQLALMQHCNQFLNLFYAAQKAWPLAIDCHRHTADAFKTAQAWPLLANVLSALAHAYIENQQPEHARDCEQRILQELPYEHAPAGYRSQKLVDIIVSRIQRRDIDSLAPLLNELKTAEDANRWRDFIAGVEADIDYAQARWEKALPYFAKMWHQAVQTQQTEQASLLEARLNTLETHLGKDTFTQALEKALGFRLDAQSATDEGDRS